VLQLTSSIQMGSNNITNLNAPSNGSDASTKSYVDGKALEFDNIDALRNISSNRTQGSDIVVYTGLKKILTTVPADSSGSDVFEVDDTITDVSGNKEAVIKDIIQTTDDIVGELQPGNNIWIIIYELQEIEAGVLSADFNVSEDIEGTGLKASVSANILRGPFDEVAHAREADDSVINVTVTRTKGVSDGSLTDPIAEINFQIENETIINADVSPGASIAQSKLLMERAAPRSSSSGLYGTGDDTGQSSRGLAAFDGDSFAHELQISLTNPLTANAGDFVYQDTAKGTVVNSVSNSSTVILRTTDTFVVGPTEIQLAVVDANGVERAKQTQEGVTVSDIDASGFIGIKDRSIGFDKLTTISTDTVLGRFNAATGDVEEVPFGTVVDQGFGLQDGDFANSEITVLSGQRLEFANPVDVVNGETITQDQGGGVTVTGTAQGGVISETFITVVNVVDGAGDSANFNSAAEVSGSTSGSIATPISVETDVSLVGAVLVKQANGIYGTTNISTVSANNTIARRTSNGSIQANSLIIGGTSTNVVLSESGNTLTFSTPGGGTILTANGTSNPTVNIPGNIDNGGTSVTQSTFQEGGDYADEAFVSTNWVYTPFIEAPGERDANGTGISLGAGTGFTSSAADTILLITGGNERVVINDTTTKVYNNLDVNDNFSVTADNGNVAFDGSLTLAGGITMNTDKFTVTTSGIVGIASTLTVGGTSNLNGNVELGNQNTDTISFNGRVDTAIIPTGTRNLGSADNTWATVYGGTFSGTATTAKYADLAENYLADAEYEPGTVVIFDGEAEVTVGNTRGDHRVAGVISTDPAHLMNSQLQGEHVVAVALSGRVPCKVLGRVKKGDLIVSSAVPGYAIADNNPRIGSVIGKAIETKNDDSKGVIEVLVGKS